MTREKKPRKGFVLVPCQGAVHQRDSIDYCRLCAPRCGWVEMHAETLHYASACADIARAKATANTPDGALVSLADRLEAMANGVE